VSLEVELARAPFTVRGDRTRVSQVIGNLLQNAAKFTDRGGHVVVRLAPAPEADAAEISVADSGIGFSPALAPHVVEPLRHPSFRADPRRGGLGLGLALVKGLVGLHGGTVSAASEGHGCGATFTIRLPLHAAAAARSAPAASAGGASRRVLIIDDNVDAAESIKTLLELQGHRAMTAYSGESGIELAAAFHPDVVLCDIGLPHGMDGYAVARRLRAQPGGSGLLLVAITGWGQPEDQRRADEAGFDLHLTKPVDPTRLDALLHV